MIREVRHALSAGGATYLLGRVLERAGLLRAALWAHAASLTRAERSRGRSVFLVLQWRQYHVERLAHRLGRGRVADPLFECRAVPAPGTGTRWPVAGYFRAEWSYSGVRIDLISRRAGNRPVQLLLDGQELRTVLPRQLPGLPGFFSITIKRPVVAQFPALCGLEVRTGDGVPLTCRGATRVELSVPHGSGRIGELLADGAAVDKKGCFSVTGADIDAAQDRFLEIYAAVREAFDNVLGTPLFLLYGTLLGFVRDGDFIPGDDDFDVGYFSRVSDPDGVREEAKEIVVRLVDAGFVVSFNRLGRLFRIRRPGDPPELHLDVTPVWYEDGMVLAHPQACIPCEAGDFLPATEAELRGVRVHLPHRPERFLETYYGPGWKVPDPSYSTDRVPITAAALRKLDRTCVDGSDYREMLARVGGLVRNGRGGRLISIGTHDLYPLKDYERNCEWSV